MKNADGKCKDLILEAMAYHLMSSEHKAKKAMNVRFVLFFIKKFSSKRFKKNINHF